MTLLAPDAAPPRPRLDELPVAVIGAGPVGLAAAAELLERGREVILYEAGAAAGSAVADWGHVRLFSPWAQLLAPAGVRLLAAHGWTAPEPEALPTGRQLVDGYLAPLAALPELGARIRTGTRVVAVTRQGMDRTRTAGRADTPFLLRLRNASGEVTETLARAVIDASGTFGTPNSLGSSGIDPMGIEKVRDLLAPALPDVLGRDRERFAGRRTLVVGAGHSAANTLLALTALADEIPGTEALWVIRNAAAVRVATPADDRLRARASLGSRAEALVDSGRIERVTGFEILRLERAGDRVRLIGARGGALADLDADVVVNATGFRPDLGMLREIRLDLDEIVEAPSRLAPLIDPNVHTCGTVERHGFTELQQPEPGFFLAGMKSYGRAPTFLLATGYEQVRSIAAWLAGDAAAARRVEPGLPAAGV
ncbi:MAG TPA: FAD-dependent oxidoreductase [Naasia sp.]